MGCSNARLLIRLPFSNTNSKFTSNDKTPIYVPSDTTNAIKRMHLSGVDFVVERNGSYTLLLTPKTYKQLMPYTLRKKRFR